MKIHLISNAKSGKGTGATLPEMAKRVCDEFNYSLVHHDTSNQDDFEGQISAAADQAEIDGGIVVAAGGDGTIRSVAEKVKGRNIKFGVIGCGTFNFFARTHQLPEDPEEALRYILHGEVQEVRLGEVNGKTFLINASLGLYAKSIRDRERRMSRWGRNRLIVIISTIITLLQRHRLLEVTLSVSETSQNIRTPMIFVGNNALQLRDLSMDVARCMKQDQLAVVLMKPLKTWEIIRAIFRGFASTIDNDEGFVSFCVDELSINTHSRRATTVALDGEMFQMKSPLMVKSLPKVLKLIKAKT